MLFDRISLVDAYGALQITEANEGKLAKILFHKTSYYGTKTVIRFDSLLELKTFINTSTSYQVFDPNCECATCDESIWTLLSFNVELPLRRYVSFVNNLRGLFESAEGALLNKLSVDALRAVFTSNIRLELLLNNFECVGYVQNQGKFVTPCDYIEVVKNGFYEEMFVLYKKTKNKFGLTKSSLFVDTCNDGIIETPYKWTTTTTTNAPLYSVETMFSISPTLPYTYASNVPNTPITTSNLTTGEEATHVIDIIGGYPWINVNQLTYTVSGFGVVFPQHGVTLYIGDHSLNVLLISGVITVAYTHFVGTNNLVQMITITDAPAPGPTTTSTTTTSTTTTSTTTTTTEAPIVLW